MQSRVNPPQNQRSCWEKGMQTALRIAEKTLAAGIDVPVGAVVLDAGGQIIAAEGNAQFARVRTKAELHPAGLAVHADPTGHAEVHALRAAARKYGTPRLDGHTLISTLEPCIMCTGAALEARIARIVFDDWDLDNGACGGKWDLARDHRQSWEIEIIGGFNEGAGREIIRAFFAAKRQARTH